MLRLEWTGARGVARVAVPPVPIPVRTLCLVQCRRKSLVPVSRMEFLCTGLDGIACLSLFLLSPGSTQLLTCPGRRKGLASTASSSRGTCCCGERSLSASPLSYLLAVVAMVVMAVVGGVAVFGCVIPAVTAAAVVAVAAAVVDGVVVVVVVAAAFVVSIAILDIGVALMVSVARIGRAGVAEDLGDRHRCWSVMQGKRDDKLVV